jgi:hypothetical protein
MTCVTKGPESYQPAEVGIGGASDAALRWRANRPKGDVVNVKGEEAARLAEAVLDRKLRGHIEGGLYPEHVRDLYVVKRAIVLCACGQTEVDLFVRGHETPACVLVQVLELWGFVQARVKARLN